MTGRKASPQTKPTQGKGRGPSPTLPRLRALVAVAQEGTVPRAARRLHDLHTAAARADDQQAVLVVDGRAVVGKAQEGSAVGGHARYFAALPMTPATR